MSPGRPFDRTGYWRWTTANGVGWVLMVVLFDLLSTLSGWLGSFAPMQTLFASDVVSGPASAWMGPVLTGLLPILLITLVSALPLGVLQWFALRPYSALSAVWAMATALTFATQLSGSLSFLASGFAEDGALLFPALGICLFGIAGAPIMQWLVARRTWSNAGVWLYLSALAILVSIPLTLAIYALIGGLVFAILPKSPVYAYSQRADIMQFSMVVSVCVAGLAYGAVTGLGIVKLRLRPGPANNSIIAEAGLSADEASGS